MTRSNSRALGTLAILAGLTLAGCISNTPNQANIELRKQNQQLRDQIEQLNRRHDADRATIRGLQAGATVAVLPQSRLDQLFTTAGLKFGILTGGYHPNPDRPGDTMLKIYVDPIDQQGDCLKAAGSFHVELFDLALRSGNRIGTWDFDLPTAKSDWYDGGLLEEYVLDCPWQTVPTHAKLLAHVTFTDALTHRIFTVDKEVKIEPPGR
jgi:outer membrane murein-binding lipoprotein Lpp